MKQIPRNKIDEIRARCDIVDVISSYLPLKNAGSRFKANCPFHKEKTPSFTVSPDRQIYHCFGCGAGGDVIGFVQEYEKVDFPDALRLLADRVGMELEFEERAGEKGTDKRALYRVNEQVATLYHRVLLEHEAAAEGRTYVEKRKLAPETVKNFLIGFAPERWDALEKWAARKKVPMALLEEAGLVIKSDKRNGYYDRFRNRLMFPILDEAGRVVGFSGRAIAEEVKGGKYVNSPETPVFRKSRVLFAIDKARKAIAESRTAILCEGQIDAIRCHEAGLSNVVASQGTALTPEHARLLKRYTDEVVLVLDADAAGQKAALASSEVFLAEELSVRVATLPDGEDPDSLIAGAGAEAFAALVDAAVSALDFLIDVLSVREDTANEAGLMRVARAVEALIAKAPGAVQRDHMIRHASGRLRISPDALRRDAAHESARRARRPAAAEKASPAPRAEHPPEEVVLVQMLLHHPEAALPLIADHLPPDCLRDPDCRLLTELLLESADDLQPRIPDDRAEARRLAARIGLEELKWRAAEGSESDSVVKDIILALWRRMLQQQRRALQQAGKRAAAQELTMQLYRINQGWEHAVEFLVA